MPEAGVPPVVLLCGGLGLRQRSESDDLPKPLRPLADGRPLVVHVMDYYRAFGLDEFVLCVGYGAQDVEAAVRSDPKAGTGSRVSCVDSGVQAGKCARLIAARARIGDRPFLLGYADVLSDFDLDRLMSSHRAAEATVTLVATRVRSRYGEVELDSTSAVTSFAEKPLQRALVSAGYFMCDPDLWSSLDVSLSFERSVLPRLAARNRLHGVVHDGRWLAFDTYKDFIDAEALVTREGFPWLQRMPV